MNSKITVTIVKKLFFLIVIFTTGLGCTETPQPKGSPEYINEINEWHANRIENLKQPDGWLSLVGLYWLEEGENSFGAGSANDIVFPAGKADEKLGTIILTDSTTKIIVEPGVEIFHNNELVSEMILENDLTGNPTVLKHRSLAWFIIKRENKYGIRVRDYEAELLKTFEGIETYPVNEDWRVEAQYVPYDPPKNLTMSNVTGLVYETQCYGKLIFEKDGETYSLDPLGKNRLFIIFADQTNGIDTYGGGRYLYAPLPDSTGKTYLDFNKAYNPPCSFTKYATCDLPPKDNYLKLQVIAGEKKYGDH